MAAVLYGMDRQCQDTAASMVMSILDRQDSHPAALQLYAVIAKDRGQVEEATRVLMRLLILDQDNAEIK
jgi:Flp pilus assembly protein TadD